MPATAPLPCARCGVRPRHTKTLCRACRARERYAADPDFRRRRVAASRKHYRSLTPEEKKDVYERVHDYQRRNAAKRTEWVTAWRLRTGRALPPDLVEFRRAVAFLEAAVERAARPQRVREPGA
jgi:hypothetical protein